jgi:hypothetical protein
MSKILNQSQAEAVYSAMCALNNIGGSISALIGSIRVEETYSGKIQVWGVRNIDAPDSFNSQADFAKAYGLS